MRARSGMERIEELIGRSRPSLVAALRARGLAPEEAEDLAQESSHPALSSRRELETDRPVLPWLVAIAMRCRIDRWRRERREESERENEDPGEIATPLDRAMAEEDRSRLRAGLAALPEADRRALDDFYRLGLGVAEIASRHGVAEGTIKARLHRARRALAARLTEDER
ncbi:MAG: sigma-70 family RNA polymerase sigma factor [Planctomycetota bacterium]